MKALQIRMAQAISESERNPSPEDRDLSWIKGDAVKNAKLTREMRLSVYKDAYIHRILEIFREDFRALFGLLGDSSCLQLTRDYLDAHPSCFRNLSEVPRFLPDFLKSYPLAAEWPYLPALADLEWKISEAFWADDAPALDLPDDYSEEQWERTELILDPSVRAIESPWPIYDLWKGGDRPIQARPEWLLLYRDFEGVVQVVRLEAALFSVLKAIEKKLTLGEIVLQLEALSAEQVQSVFESWTREGIIRGVKHALM